MATSVIALSGSLLTGPNLFGPLTPPAGTTVIQVAIDRTSLALLTQSMDVALELSLDGGSTRLFRGGCTLQAGTISALSESSIIVNILASDANTRLYGSVTTKETVVTTVTVRYA